MTLLSQSHDDNDDDVPSYQYHWKYLSVLSIGVLSSTFLFFIGVYLIFKIYRIVHLKGDPALLMSIVSITIALACMMAFNFLGVLRVFSWDNEPFIKFHINGVLLNQIDRLKLAFMFLSLVFDVYKWSIFLASTGE
jgi:hypothetical protein